MFPQPIGFPPFPIAHLHNPGVQMAQGVPGPVVPPGPIPGAVDGHIPQQLNGVQPVPDSSPNQNEHKVKHLSPICIMFSATTAQLVSHVRNM
jgi:hypothetical protein